MFRRTFAAVSAAALTCAGNTGLADTAASACAPAERACLARETHADDVHRLDAWKERLARPLLERVDAAPAELVAFLRRENGAAGLREQPRPMDADTRLLADVQGALADLPPAVQLLFVNRLAGVLLLEDLGGTGHTDVILDDAGEPIAGFIVLDAGVLRRLSANAWASAYESAAFMPEGTWQVEARIEAAPQDNRRAAVRAILLRQLGHVLAIGSDVHPAWWLQPRDVTTPEGYAFFALSWTVDASANRYVSVFDEVFPQRRQLGPDAGARLRAGQMRSVYEALQRTNFATLQAARRPADDFAESFASYVHSVLMRRPWEITVSRGGEPVLALRACWDEPRCADKRALLEKILARGP